MNHYEELRAAIDGGSESMTHEDAMAQIAYWREQCAVKPAQEPLDLRDWTPCIKLPVVVHVRQQKSGETHVSTREGITPVKPDDLIMRGVSGEEYPIGKEIFEKTYTLDVDAPAAQPAQPLPCPQCRHSDSWGIPDQTCKANCVDGRNFEPLNAVKPVKAQPAREPVAYRGCSNCKWSKWPYGQCDGCSKSSGEETDDDGNWEADDAAQPAQERKPLTDEQIDALVQDCQRRAYPQDQYPHYERAFARAIEQAHGIGSKT